MTNLFSSDVPVSEVMAELAGLRSAQSATGFFPGTGTASPRPLRAPAPHRRGLAAGLGLFFLGLLILGISVVWGFYVWMLFDEGSFYAHTAFVDSVQVAATRTPPTTRSEVAKAAEKLHLTRPPAQPPAPPQVIPAPVPPPEPPAPPAQPRGEYLPPVRHQGEYYTVQIAASETPEQAIKILAQLKDLGFEGYFYRVHVKTRPYFRVRVGRYEGFSQAKALEKKLVGHGFTGMFVANLDDEAPIE